jgi:L-glyceraldehyde 3-phosphate reductase
MGNSICSPGLDQSLPGSRLRIFSIPIVLIPIAAPRNYRCLIQAVRSGAIMQAFQIARIHAGGWNPAGFGDTCLIHQPRFSLLDQTPISSGVLKACEDEGIGCIAFSALGQGILTSKYLKGIPKGSRATQGKSLSPETISEKMIEQLNRLNAIAIKREQSLAQMAIAWASKWGDFSFDWRSSEQIKDCVGALRTEFFVSELSKSLNSFSPAAVTAIG